MIPNAKNSAAGNLGFITITCSEHIVSLKCILFFLSQRDHQRILDLKFNRKKSSKVSSLVVVCRKLLCLDLALMFSRYRKIYFRHSTNYSRVDLHFFCKTTNSAQTIIFYPKQLTKFVLRIVQFGSKNIF